MRHTSIPTVYAGVRFRSRLEARWAAFFDAMKWRWDYEPIDLNGWIPDFTLDAGDTRFLVEVKPVRFVEELVEVARGVQVRDRDTDIMILGIRPLGMEYEDGEINRAGWSEIYAIGVDNERCILRPERRRSWEPCGVHMCRGCGFIGVNMTCQTVCCRSDNKGSCGGADIIVADAWKAAKNVTQFRSAAP